MLLYKQQSLQKGIFLLSFHLQMCKYRPHSLLALQQHHTVYLLCPAPTLYFSTNDELAQSVLNQDHKPNQSRNTVLQILYIAGYAILSFGKQPNTQTLRFSATLKCSRKPIYLRILINMNSTVTVFWAFDSPKGL